MGTASDRLEQLKPLLESVGFTRVQKHIVPVPVGKWGGKVGKNSYKVYAGLWKKLMGPISSANPDIQPRLIRQALELYESEMDLRRSYYQIIVYIAQRPPLP